MDNGIPLAPTDNKLKRKREGTDEPRKDAKLQEYLEVMQPPSKSKTWANEDNSVTRTSTAAHVEVSNLENQDGQSDEEYKKVSTQFRQRRADPEPREHSKLTKPLVSTPNEYRSEAPASSHTYSLPVQPTSSAEFDREGLEGPIAATDADWLRTRTSRLLGLADNDEDLNRSAAEHSALPSPEEQFPVDQSEETPAPDAESKGNQEYMPEVFPLSLNDSNVAAIEVSGRLFVRNLPYSAGEDDLRHFFSSTGDLEEVRLPSITSSAVCFCSRSVMNTLIGTAYALQVMLPKRVF